MQKRISLDANESFVACLCSKFDLYSKADSLPDKEALRPYYQSLVDQFVPGKIKF